MAPTTRNNGTAGTSSQSNDLNTNEQNPELSELVQAQVKKQLEQILKNMPQFSSSAEHQQWIEADKAYVTPPFAIRAIADHEKLHGTKNFKSWKMMIELDLKALNLYPFVTSKCGEEVRVSPSRRVVLDAQALQYVKASVDKSISYRLSDICTAFDAVESLTKMFGNNKTQNYIDLHNRFMRLRFKPNFEPNRFIGDFEQLIKDYSEMGTTFPEDFIVTILLQKIEGIHDPKSPYFSFFQTIASLPAENQNLEYIKQRFITVAMNSNSTTQGDKNSMKRVGITGAKNESYIKRPRLNQSPTPNTNESYKAKPMKTKYTDTQLEKLKTMSKEEKKSIQCKKCGEYFHGKTECPNPGRMCFACFKYGHEKKECKFNKTKGNTG